MADFLKVEPREVYDLIVMNPPFGKQGELYHVLHALKFLKEGGVMAAVLPVSARLREDKRSVDFRRVVGRYVDVDSDSWNGPWRDLPSRSFDGTNVNTVTLCFRKVERKR